MPSLLASADPRDSTYPNEQSTSLNLHALVRSIRFYALVLAWSEAFVGLLVPSRLFLLNFTVFLLAP